MEKFETAFATFFEGCKKISHDYMGKQFPTLNKPPFEIVHGSKYTRVFREGSCHAFVDRKTGDVLKPASWKTPAKHARGNIYDESNGLKTMGPYGPAYLR